MLGSPCCEPCALNAVTRSNSQLQSRLHSMALNVNVRRPTGQAIQRFNKLVSLHFSFLCRRNMALSCTTASLVWAEALLTTAPNQPPLRGRWVLTQQLENTATNSN